MKCSRVQDLFSSYLENTMESSDCVVFEQHLAECAHCKAAYDRFNAAVMLLEEAPEVEVPPDFHAAVMSRVQRERRTAPSPVKWWRVDWQHVFTIRVPARAAAMGLAVLLLAALIVELTPVHTGMANLFGARKTTSHPIGLTPQDAPGPWSPWGSPKYGVGDSGLLISVTPDSRGAFALRLGTHSRKSVAFAIDAADENYNGFVVSNQGSVVQVPVPQSLRSVVARVSWNYKDKARTELAFLPRKFDSQASRKNLTFSVQNASVYDVLRKISEDYGIVVLASGDMKKYVGYITVDNRGPEEALYQILQDADMKSSAVAPSIYAVEPVH